MLILRANDAPRFELTAVHVVGLASPSRGSSEITSYRIIIEPGGAAPRHRHDHEEVFTVVAGSVTAVLDGEEHVLGNGDTLIVRSGTEHYTYVGDTPAEVIATVPAGTLFITSDGAQSIPDRGA